MGEKKNRGAANSEAPGSCQQCPRWKKAKESVSEVRLREVLDDAISKMEKSLKEETFKPTVGDYMKLMQMERELRTAVEDVKEIRVTWVAPPESGTEE